jgi:cyclopropane fatty-acyl-phospholipid synthase-like methyltransferase
MNRVIGADHAFHDVAFVESWAARFAPTPERLELFNVILEQLKLHMPANGHVVELGIGPGYLADYLLSRMPDIQYLAVDFSLPMLHIAQQRLHRFAERISYIQADLVTEPWWEMLPSDVNAVVSTWALHDLGSQENVGLVYRCCAPLLPIGGVLLNGDFIKPDNAIYGYEQGRFEIGKHFELLRRAGFSQTECLVVLEEEIEMPTAAQNYACLKGVI